MNQQDAATSQVYYLLVDSVESMMMHGLANPKCLFRVNLAQSLDRPRAPWDVTDIMRSVYKNSLEVQAIRPQVPVTVGGIVYLTTNSK